MTSCQCIDRSHRKAASSIDESPGASSMFLQCWNSGLRTQFHLNNPRSLAPLGARLLHCGAYFAILNPQSLFCPGPF
jgi:hypothetical protein